MDRQECSKDDSPKIGITDIIECVRLILSIILAILLSPILFLMAFVFGHALQKASEIPEDLYEQHKKPGQCIETENDEEKERYFQYIYSCASERIKCKALSKDSVHGYIRHLPIRGDADCDGWGEEVLDISDKCLHELWEYSKEMGFIGKDFPYDKFIRRKF